MSMSQDIKVVNVFLKCTECGIECSIPIASSLVTAFELMNELEQAHKCPIENTRHV